MTTPIFRNTRFRSSGFTLIELLTVIAIIAILAGILIPSVGKVRQASYAATSTSNLRQMGSAMELVVLDGAPYTSKNTYPPYAGIGLNNSRYSWHTLLAEKMDLVVRDGNEYKWLVEPHLSVFQNPGNEDLFDPDDVQATSSYGYSTVYDAEWWHSNPVNNEKKNAPIRKINIEKPGRSILIGESNEEGSFRNRIAPGTWAGVSDWYKGGGHFLFGDGHVEWILKADIVADTNRYFKGHNAK